MTISRIAIIGGHGRIALLLAQILNSQGLAVRSIIRSPEQSDTVREHGGQPVICDVEHCSTRELQDAVGESEAVVFAAGAGAGSGAFRKYTMDLAGSVRSVQAAQAAGVRRFIQISFIGAERSVQDGTEEVFSAYWDAKREADNALRASADLDWTIVKPGLLTEEQATGMLDVGTGLPRGGTTSRGDVAAFIAHVLDDPRTFGRDLDIVDGSTPLGVSLDRHVAG